MGAEVGLEVTLALVLVKLMGVRVAEPVVAAVVLLRRVVKPAEAVVLAEKVEDDDAAVVVVLAATLSDELEDEDEVEDDDEELVVEVEVTGGRAATETTAPSHSDRGLPTGQQSCSPAESLAQ